MKVRKTIEVSIIKNMVNDMLLNSSNDQKDTRESMGRMIESVLMATGNYKGFRYLTNKDMEYSDNGNSIGIDDTLTIIDNSRVEYF